MKTELDFEDQVPSKGIEPKLGSGVAAASAVDNSVETGVEAETTPTGTWAKTLFRPNASNAMEDEKDSWTMSKDMGCGVDKCR